MNEKWWTSDLHFHHARICEFTDRPTTPDEHTEWLIDIWNKQVAPGDIVYHLGDFTFAKQNKLSEVAWIIQRLNGVKFFIRGNHCYSDMWRALEEMKIHNVSWIGHYKELTIQKQAITMLHYPMVMWRNSHHGTWQLHGHTHGSYKHPGKCLDVGIDNAYNVLGEHRFFNFDDIKKYMDKQPIYAPDHHGRYKND